MFIGQILERLSNTLTDRY